MKIFSIRSVLLTMGICRVAAQGILWRHLPVSSSLKRASEALYTATIEPTEEDRTLKPLENRNGWVNPEDLTPMPQCIAQQDQSTWLSTMTKCTSKQCTRHFGVICTHHQWLTQLSCLSTEFSPDVVRPYLPYCGRSVLAKAQLFRWIRTITGRTWLVDVGDTNELQNLSPASLTEGYAAFDVANKAPRCLTESASASSMESFQHAMASCGFTSNSQHTGNAARPWEYSEPLQSMIALDFETVGYDLIQHEIAYGDYFDKRCFCRVFSTDWGMEPCSGTGLDSTRERLWMHATCGPTSVPGNWTDGLKTTKYAYIPTKNWRWPDCVADMPKKVVGLTDQCATDACELDSHGYCRIMRAVDRACFCRNINYNTCKGSCHVFETRIDFVKWLHELCGSEQGWHGLPKHWRQLSAPTPLEMIPWRWSVKPLKRSSPGSVNRPKSCASTEWKLGSLILVNTATVLFQFYSLRTGIRLPAYLHKSYPRPWVLTGVALAAFHLLANWINAVIIQSTPGHEDMPITQLVLLWCSMPRVTWLTVLLVGIQPFEATNFSTAASCLFAEAILQALSASHIIGAVDYGREHDFYSYGMERLASASSAQFMYAGALMWLVVIIVLVLVLLIPVVRRTRSQTREQPTRNVAEGCMVPFKNERWTRLEEKLLCDRMSKSRNVEETPLTSGEGHESTDYGTLPVKAQKNQSIDKVTIRLYSITIISMALLWIAQWLFWAGFIGLSVDEYVPMRARIGFNLANCTKVLPPEAWSTYSDLDRLVSGCNCCCGDRVNH
jgi:hypothetical protein